MARRFTSVLVLSVLFSSTAFAQHIYKWKDNKGQWHFSNNPPAGVGAQLMKGMNIPKESAQPDKVPPAPADSISIETPSTAPSPLQSYKAQSVALPQRIVVPFSRDGGHVIVAGIVNGMDRVKFILDTGAESTSIPLDLVKQSRIDVKKGVLMPFSGIGGVVWEPVVDIDSLRVGEAEIKNLSVSIPSEGMLVRMGRGLLGADFLDVFRVDIEYDQNQVILERIKGPYAGYPAVWWQRRFRFYHHMKLLYKKLHKDAKIHMTAGLMQQCQNARRRASPEPYNCRIVEGLRTIEKKLINLDSRAYHAGVPLEFRK